MSDEARYNARASEELPSLEGAAWYGHPGRITEVHAFGKVERLCRKHTSEVLDWARHLHHGASGTPDRTTFVCERCGG